MSLEDFLADQPPAYVASPKNFGAVNTAGMPVDQWDGARQVIGRPFAASARQKLMWESVRNIVADYNFITTDGGILNGDFLQLNDGRLFRVMGTGEQTYAKGTIDDFWEYPLQEIRAR